MFHADVIDSDTGCFGWFVGHVDKQEVFVFKNRWWACCLSVMSYLLSTAEISAGLFIVPAPRLTGHSCRGLLNRPHIAL